MTRRLSPWRAGALLLLALPPALRAADSDWKENEPATAPAFSRDRLVRFEALTNSEMRYGIDPATLSLGSDGVVRYVMVVTSPSGALNASYDGIHCTRGEFRNYARWSPGSDTVAGHWILADTSAGASSGWRSLFSGYATKPALSLARAAFCDGTSPNGTVDRMLRDLRQGR